MSQKKQWCNMRYDVCSDWQLVLLKVTGESLLVKTVECVPTLLYRIALLLVRDKEKKNCNYDRVFFAQRSLRW